MLTMNNVMQENIKRWLKKALPPLLQMHLRERKIPELILEEQTSLKALEAAGLIRFANVQAANGIDCTCGLLVIAHRGYNEGIWKGDAVEDHHFLVALSRAKRRLYLLVEDLRAGVVLLDNIRPWPTGLYGESEVRHQYSAHQLRVALKEGLKAVKLVNLFKLAARIWTSIVWFIACNNRSSSCLH